MLAAALLLIAFALLPNATAQNPDLEIVTTPDAELPTQWWENPAIAGPAIAALITGLFGLLYLFLRKGDKARKFQIGKQDTEGNLTNVGGDYVNNASEGPNETTLALADRYAESKAMNALQGSEIEHLKKEINDLTTRIEETGEQKERDALEEVRESGDSAELIRVLEEEAHASEETAIARYHEIAAVAYLTGKIDKAENALESVLARSPSDLDAHNKMGHIYKLRGNLDGALQAYHGVLSFASKVNAKDWQAAATGNIGIVHQTKGDVDKALNFFFKALKIDTELDNKKGMAVHYGNIGVSFKAKGDFGRALEFYDKSLTIDIEIENREGMANQYGNIGNVYRIQGDMDTAIEYYQKVLKIDMDLGRSESIAKAYGNMGIAYHEKGNSDKALDFFKNALTMNKDLGNREGVANQYGNIGNIYLAKSDWDMALDYYEKALAINEALGLKAGIANQYGNIGNVHQERGDVECAKANWKKSLELFDALGAPHMVEKIQGMLDALDEPPAP